MNINFKLFIKVVIITSFFVVPSVVIVHSSYDTDYYYGFEIDVFSGTPLEGANADPSIVLPDSTPACPEPNGVEQQISITHAYSGFLPPDGYDQIGSHAALKLLENCNISGSWEPLATSRWESTTIDVFLNNVSGAKQACQYVEDAFDGLFTFNYVDSIPSVGIQFKDVTDINCGSAWTRRDNTRNHIEFVIISMNATCSANRINVLIHELLHGLGLWGHFAIKNTVMTLGGIMNDHYFRTGTVDDVSISVLKNLYRFPAGTKIDPITYEVTYHPNQDLVEQFVTRFYQQCLSRDPDASGLNGWTNALLNGTLTGSDVATSFIFSDEFINRYTTNEDFVTILYRAFFNREPDSAGYSGWLNALYDGTSRSDVLNGFTSSQEFINLCGNYGITPN